jgi:hypothetical protein
MVGVIRASSIVALVKFRLPGAGARSSTARSWRSDVATPKRATSYPARFKTRINGSRVAANSTRSRLINPGESQGPSERLASVGGGGAGTVEGQR